MDYQSPKRHPAAFKTILIIGFHALLIAFFVVFANYRPDNPKEISSPQVAGEKTISMSPSPSPNPTTSP